jgi:hypothetical protein
MAKAGKDAKLLDGQVAIRNGQVGAKNQGTYFIVDVHPEKSLSRIASRFLMYLQEQIGAPDGSVCELEIQRPCKSSLCRQRKLR